MKNDEILPEKLELLSTSDLEKELHLELGKDSQDGSRIRGILRALRQRDAAELQEIPESVKTAWLKHQKEAEPEIHAPKQGKNRVLWQLGKITVVAAVLCIVIFAVPRAFGAENLFELVAYWTDDTFQFVRPGETIGTQEEYVFETDHPGLQAVYDTVTGLGVNVPVVPMWVPKDFELTALSVIEKSKKTIVYARLGDEETHVVLQVYIGVEENDEQLQLIKDHEDVEEKEIGNVLHYVMSNSGEWMAVWPNDCVECVCSTDLEKGELIKILRSIYQKG